MLKEITESYKFVKAMKSYSKDKGTIESDRSLLYLQKILGTQGGIFTKIVQYLGTSDPTLNSINSIKSDNIQGLDNTEIEKILSSLFGQEHAVKNISKEAYFASIGQVNTAKLNDKKVAIKTQYPNIEDKLKSQLKLLNLTSLISKVSHLKKWDIKFDDYLNSIKKLIDEECNYILEVRKLKEWKEYLESYQNVDVPFVYDQYVNRKLYIQEFIEGERAEDVIKHWSPSEKMSLSELLYKTYIKLLIDKKVVQADTNFANFIFSRMDGIKLYFIDLGQTHQFANGLIMTLFTILNEKFENKPICSKSFFYQMGFDMKKLEHLGDRLDLLVEAILNPFLSNTPVKFSDWDYAKKIDLILADDKWWFRSAGGQDFFILMKSFMGIKNLLIQLDQSLNFKKLTQEVFDEISFNSINYKKDSYQNKDKILSKGLRIRIIRDGEEKVNIQLPINSLFNLKNLIDSEIIKKIEKRGISIDKLAYNAFKDGGKPKELFILDEESQRYILEMI